MSTTPATRTAAVAETAAEKTAEEIIKMYSEATPEMKQWLFNQLRLNCDLLYACNPTLVNCIVPTTSRDSQICYPPPTFSVGLATFSRLIEGLREKKEMQQQLQEQQQKLKRRERKEEKKLQRQQRQLERQQQQQQQQQTSAEGMPNKKRGIENTDDVTDGSNKNTKRMRMAMGISSPVEKKLLLPCGIYINPSVAQQQARQRLLSQRGPPFCRSLQRVNKALAKYAIASFCLPGIYKKRKTGETGQVSILGARSTSKNSQQKLSKPKLAKCVVDVLPRSQGRSTVGGTSSKSHPVLTCGMSKVINENAINRKLKNEAKTEGTDGMDEEDERCRRDYVVEERNKSDAEEDEEEREITDDEVEDQENRYEEESDDDDEEEEEEDEDEPDVGNGNGGDEEDEENDDEDGEEEAVEEEEEEDDEEEDAVEEEEAVQAAAAQGEQEENEDEEQQEEDEDEEEDSEIPVVDLSDSEEDEEGEDGDEEESEDEDEVKVERRDASTNTDSTLLGLSRSSSEGLIKSVDVATETNDLGKGGNSLGDPDTSDTGVESESRRSHGGSDADDSTSISSLSGPDDEEEDEKGSARAPPI